MIKKQEDKIKKEQALTIEEKPIKPKIIEKGEVDMKGVLNNRKKIEITGYDLQLGRFDCEDETTRAADDFKEFILTYEELLDISKNNEAVAID